MTDVTLCLWYEGDAEAAACIEAARQFRAYFPPGAPDRD